MLLPPVGTPLDSDLQGKICSVIQLLKDESRLVRDTYVEWADLCRQYYTYGASEAADEGTIVIQDIQNAVIVQTDVQTKEPPTITLEPVDTGEPPQYFWAADPLSASQIGLQPQEYQNWVGPDGTAKPPIPLSAISTAKVQQAIAAGVLPASAVQEVSISEVCDLFQKVFQVIWDRSPMEGWFHECTLLNNVDGWVPVTYEFDDEALRFLVTNQPIRQVFMDPTSMFVERQAYNIVDIPYDAEVAKALYPDYADVIEAEADPTGKLVRPPETLEMGSQFEDVPTFNHPMITLTVMFLRDQPVFMTPQEALASGQLEQAQLPTGNWTHQTNPQNPALLDIVEETREALVHPETGEEVLPPDHEDFDPENTQWPMKRGIRQTTAIATRNIVLEDTVCGYYDFPTALNINVPVLGKPYGVGEPYRMRGMQDGRTRIMNNVVNHSDYFGAPITWAPLSAKEQMPEGFENGHAMPGTHFWIPDNIVLQTSGKPMGQQDPPEIPPALLEVDDKLKRELNDTGGNMAAIQGQPAADMSQLSGVAIGMIQSGAASLASFKAQQAKQMILRIARLGLHSLLTRVTAAQIGQIIKKYPPHVLEALVGMAPSLEWNIRVSLAAGAGQMLAQKKAEAKQNYQMGLQSKTTTQEACGIDPGQEDQRQQQEALEQARLQQTMQPPAPAQQPANGQRQQAQGQQQRPNAAEQGT